MWKVPQLSHTLVARHKACPQILKGLSLGLVRKMESGDTSSEFEGLELASLIETDPSKWRVAIVAYMVIARMVSTVGALRSKGWACWAR